MRRTITFLVKANSVKGRILITSIMDSQFYKDYEINMIFNSNTGNNVDLASKSSIKVLFSDKNLELLKQINTDYLVACGWGWKIPEYAISKAKIAALNCHSSYLPDYKGGDVYFHYWANCEKFGGATVHFLSNNFDTGAIVTQEKFAIAVKDTPEDILVKASEITAVLIREALLLMDKGYKGFSQKGGRYFYKMSNREFKMYRAVNRVLELLKIEKKYFTRNKVVDI